MHLGQNVTKTVLCPSRCIMEMCLTALALIIWLQCVSQVSPYKMTVLLPLLVNKYLESETRHILFLFKLLFINFSSHWRISFATIITRVFPSSLLQY